MNLSLTPKDYLNLSAEALIDRVETGLADGAIAIVQAGLALKEIQRRGDYPSTFAIYVREHFDLTVGRAYQLIYAAEIIADLSEEFDAKQLPRSESAVRPLIRLTKEQRVEVWRRALKGRRRSPGNGVVKEIVADLYGQVS